MIFPITPDGLMLPALLGLDTNVMHQLMSQGKPLIRPIPVRVQIDTGTLVTAVVPRILSALGAVAEGTKQTQTAGISNVQLYYISFTLFDPTGNSPTTLTRASWLVTDLPQDLPDVDVLLGMDLNRVHFGIRNFSTSGSSSNFGHKRLMMPSGSRLIRSMNA